MKKLFAMGKNAVCELLEKRPELADEIFIMRTLERDDQKYLDKLTALAKQAQVRIHQSTKEKLSEMAGSDSHQGYLCSIRDFHPVDLKQFISAVADQESVKIAMLDSIMDPHNLGAILRAADCFGLDAVIWSKNRGASLSSVVIKVSAGGAFYVPIIQVSNLVDTARKLKDVGFWVIGCEKGQGATELSKFDFAPKSVIVLGSEGDGIAPLLSKELDGRVWIPMKGQVESLNVSQAASVVFSRF